MKYQLNFCNILFLFQLCTGIRFSARGWNHFIAGDFTRRSAGPKLTAKFGTDRAQDRYQKGRPGRTGMRGMSGRVRRTMRRCTEAISTGATWSTGSRGLFD